MPRKNRNMQRQSFFLPVEHASIVEKLAHRKGLTTSDIYRALVKAQLRKELEALQKRTQQ